MSSSCAVILTHMSSFSTPNCSLRAHWQKMYRQDVRKTPQKSPKQLQNMMQKMPVPFNFLAGKFYVSQFCFHPINTKQLVGRICNLWPKMCTNPTFQIIHYKMLVSQANTKPKISNKQQYIINIKKETGEQQLHKATNKRSYVFVLNIAIKKFLSLQSRFRFPTQIHTNFLSQTNPLFNVSFSLYTHFAAKFNLEKNGLFYRFQIYIFLQKLKCLIKCYHKKLILIYYNIINLQQIQRSKLCCQNLTAVKMY
eukprot:TRINITY_DN4845_c0_g1_i5.p1 TRINITY_DN4845_c0_g1~~TRINITY_DN4845_c0_g1_i5.p1  ORF type:complete len:252 (-),score=-10.21 TRINITY_DN4845_c0_g1_i5:548-1303(-)